MTSDVNGFIEDSKKLIGAEVEEWGQPGNLVATQPALRGFCNVIGEYNPLYNEPDYAYRTRYGCVTATPVFLAGIRTPESYGAYAKRDYGLANFLSSVEFKWYDIIHVIDRFSTELKTTDVFERETQVFGKPEKKHVAYVEAKGSYVNQYGSLVGEASSLMSMIPFNRGTEMFVDRQLYQYTPEESERYGKGIENELRRGMSTLFWDDVNVGDKLAPVVKGPLELAPLLGWPGATRSVDWHLENYYKRAKEAPGEARTNPVTNWPYWVEQLEFASYHTCTLRGVSFPFAPGMQQACIAGNLLSNWMSDDGFLRRLRMEVYNVFMYGDINVYGGEVTDKYKEQIGENMYGAVEVKIDVTNELGEKVCSGDATVYLPFPGRDVELPIVSREKGGI